MVAKPLCPLYKNIIKPLDRARYPELRYIIVDSYMFRTGEVVCIYVSKYLVVEMECIAF